MIQKSALILLGVLVLFSCKKADNTQAEGSGGKALSKDTSYALGMAIGSSVQDMILEFDCDYDALTQGFREYLENKKTKFTLEEAIAQVNAVYNEVREANSEMFREEQQAYLTENSKKTGVQTTASGLQYEVLSEGTGAKPLISDTVQVHYEGSLVDGTVFDSSYLRGEPIEFPLQGVIPGWTEGLQLMQVGSSYRLFIPSELGYGAQGAGGVIPPYSTLIFKVELLSIVK